MTKWFTRLFGCRHKRVSFPIRVGRVDWCTCLDCGKVLDYVQHTGAEWLN